MTSHIDIVLSFDEPTCEQIQARYERPFTRKEKKKKRIPYRLRKEVYERDAYRCVSCGSWHDLSIDHIIPESKGGETVSENLQTMCRFCNSRKGNRDL